MKTSYGIRGATEGDLGAINAIYNHYVRHSTCTYQEEPETLASRKDWFGHHGANYPVIVATAGEKVVGWGSLSAFHTRSAYRYTVENSLYVHPQHVRAGIGTLLLQELIVRCRRLGYRTLIAGIDAGQEASIALHSRFRFEKVGHLKRVGFKFDRWLDVIYMELGLESADEPSPGRPP